MSQARVIRGIILSACFLLCSGAVFAQAPATPGTDDPAANSLMQQARDFEAAGNYNRAATTYRDIVKRHSVSTAAPTAQFRLAELIDQAGNPNRAFDAYQSLVESYPQSREFDRAVTAQLAIADDFMQRRRYERAGEMYAAILSAAPFAKFAPAAQFKLGQSYESRREYAQAIAAYQSILDRYPSSDYADDALYQIGFVQLTEAQSAPRTSRRDRRQEHLREFLMEYPNSEKAAQARENLARMGGREATDLMSIARFYDRNNNFRAAVIYYAELVRRQSGSEDAKIATDRIEEIRATVGDEELRSGPNGRDRRARRHAPAPAEPGRDLGPQQLRRATRRQGGTCRGASAAQPPVAHFGP